ncbi:MAG TPA: phosphoribosylformylglycinamidine synthase I [Pirellulales bacterium]|jgi:phosphoribosylformylglycinamidine synthase
MAQPRALILRAPGTNCDVETAHAFERAGAAPKTLHVNRSLENPRVLDEFQILCIPGGFSYGDDVAAGRIFGNQIRHHLGEQLHAFREQGKLVLGICNGFQVLLRSGILFDDLGTAEAPPATLDWNDSGKFEDRWVRLQVASGPCVFFQGITSMYLPVAHAEGKFVLRDQQVLKKLESRGQIVLRYATKNAPHVATESYPENPNGSTVGIAGVCDATGRVCGFMPHPERHIDRTQHPRWTRGEGSDEGDGLRVFRNAVEYFR